MRWHGPREPWVIALIVAGTVVAIVAMHRPVCVCTCHSPPDVSIVSIPDPDSRLTDAPPAG